ncbi:MAG: hypothetical protein LBF38_01705 [Deltaproteobacteria bacterium]|jgi:hypothetical protein|nr:hypothetical protein [Deltaproteobacteria bacterium]
MGEYTVWELIIILLLVTIIFGFNQFLGYLKRPKAPSRSQENPTKQEENL